MLWAYRAKAECAAATRTWFGTLTFAPEHHLRFVNLARRAASRNGDDYDAFPQERRFALIHAEASKEVTKMLKRVRSASGVPFKYLCVVEAHKSGYPHYHLLVHERSHEKQLRWKLLSSQWRHGFSKWRLVVDPGEATYITKYVNKSDYARVRASVAYGDTI